jgi:hypothetical protein
MLNTTWQSFQTFQLPTFLIGCRRATVAVHCDRCCSSWTNSCLRVCLLTRGWFYYNFNFIRAACSLLFSSADYRYLFWRKHEAKPSRLLDSGQVPCYPARRVVLVFGGGQISRRAYLGQHPLEPLSNMPINQNKVKKSHISNQKIFE